MGRSDEVSVLFVCMGNICRSPTAEGVFRKRVEEASLDLNIQVDSAGTHNYHIGEPPDSRATDAALKRGIDISALRARAVAVDDFRRFDYILAMDDDNLSMLARIRPEDSSAEVKLLLDYCEATDIRHVPDPYYGGSAGFEQVLDLLDVASEALIEHFRRS